MKLLLLTFLFLISFQVSALDKAKNSFYLIILKNDKTTVSGEFIERYEDRWFYEEDNPLVKKYYLLFELVKGKPTFHMVQAQDVARISLYSYQKSGYRRFLIDNDLGFQNEIIAGMDILTGNSWHHKFEKMFGNFAWDLGVLDIDGNQHGGEGLQLSDYYVFDKRVYSPVSGTVVGKVSNQFDNKASPNLVGDLSKKMNNYLTIKMMYPFYLSVVHFKKDTITVNVGDSIKAGKELGRVGNSGVSYIPHLHYTLYIYEEGLKRFISVPAYFDY
jgi:murein DD-endopeptidase MepM/ murein hydrolase activator NlpD